MSEEAPGAARQGAVGAGFLTHMAGDPERRRRTPGGEPVAVPRARRRSGVRPRTAHARRTPIRRSSDPASWACWTRASTSLGRLETPGASRTRWPSPASSVALETASMRPGRCSRKASRWHAPPGDPQGKRIGLIGLGRLAIDEGDYRRGAVGPRRGRGARARTRRGLCNRHGADGTSGRSPSRGVNTSVPGGCSRRPAPPSSAAGPPHGAVHRASAARASNPRARATAPAPPGASTSWSDSAGADVPIHVLQWKGELAIDEGDVEDAQRLLRGGPRSSRGAR